MSKVIKTIFTFVSLFTILSILVPCSSWAQKYPDKPINLVVSWPPGGVSPILSTLIAEEAKKYIPQPVVVLYKTGAAGTIGASYVAKSKPDGYTLLLARAGHISCAPSIRKVDYDPLDFEVTGQLTREPGTLAVRADAPWKNLKEFVAYAKKNPGIVTVGASGTYSPNHLNMLRFEQVAGIKLNHVPFKGAGPTMTALAGGHVAAAARWPGEGEPLIAAGKVRVLTVFAPKRCKFYPDVPTSAEEGYPLSAEGYTSIMGPKGTPKEVIKVWDDILKKLANDKAFVKKADELHLIIQYQSPEDFKKYLHEQIREVRALAKKLNLK